MKYDFKKAKTLIEAERENIERASLGIREDWYWTADTVYEDGSFKIDLDTVEEISGISGSSWGTPYLEIEYKDGSSKMVPCHDNGPSDPSARPIWV
ncbi:hypothetical protein [Streptococcus suis]|uniref:hypothetical protein n=1 Tax=Streptococcus suis TaxID=1307 RepID=UPI001CF4456A|nr:hypothetical protein [Streptococcus suis]MCB2882322.1 hypothetical protein [Streptococcus suis]MCB2911083.1 hypothetical protein [Streptococcus suis]MCB2911180.1 hypothetical protein [Streptococcus suis]MCB2913219.1 hypothetical protein [Streptococcus suis]MDW8585347.1 hypothetical protein [Streptococcus suis]